VFSRPVLIGRGLGFARARSGGFRVLVDPELEK
jgi:hypothetical protein